MVRLHSAGHEVEVQRTEGEPERGMCVSRATVRALRVIIRLLLGRILHRLRHADLVALLFEEQEHCFGLVVELVRGHSHAFFEALVSLTTGKRVKITFSCTSCTALMQQRALRIRVVSHTGTQTTRRLPDSKSAYITSQQYPYSSELP